MYCSKDLPQAVLQQDRQSNEEQLLDSTTHIYEYPAMTVHHIIPVRFNPYVQNWPEHLAL